MQFLFARKLVARSFLYRTQKTMSTTKRGALIVFEGCDKSGKSTQCGLLVERLNKAGVTAQLWKFPDRTTMIGKMIDGYLQQSCHIEDHAIHLLFAANRWEATPKLKELLESGVTLVVDRYSFSGVAFSAAKSGMSMEWCRHPEQGLLQPDRVFYLTVGAEVASRRGDFGVERYEKKDFQDKVSTMFDKLKDDTWTEINADKTIDELSDELFTLAMNVVQSSQLEKLYKLWE